MHILKVRSASIYNLSSSDLPALITQAVEDSRLRANARHLSEAISKTDGLAMAAELIEKALGHRAADRGCRGDRANYGEGRFECR